MITVNDILVPGELFYLHVSLLFIEIMVIFIAFFYVIVSSYVIFILHPHFHPHLLAITTSFFITFFILSIPRLIIIFMFLSDRHSNFEISINKPITIYMDGLRTAAASIALVATTVLVLERLVATLRIRTYEKERKPILLGIILMFTWIFPLISCYTIVAWQTNLICFMLIGFICVITSFVIFGRLYIWSEDQYKRHSYCLTIKYQLSENVRFGRILKCTLQTFTIGSLICLIIVFLTIKVFPKQPYFVFSMYHLYEGLIALLPIQIVNNTINSDTTWKRKFQKLIGISGVCRRANNQTAALAPIRVLSLTGEVITVAQQLQAREHFSGLENMWR